MARPNVPEFGKWEGEADDVPYTLVFDNARKNKGGKGGSGKMINPNEHPELFANAAAFADPPPSRHRPRHEEPVRRGGSKAPPPREAKEDREFKQQFADSPARYLNGGRAGAANDSPLHHQNGGGGRGTGSGRPRKPSAGSEHSFEKSPLHPQQRAGLSGRGGGGGSPSVDGKRSVATPHGTPSRLKPAKTRDEAPARDVIPQFGDWDVNDPRSADNFTYVFNKNAKNASAHEPNTTPSPPRSPQKRISDDSVKFQCCFAWGKK